MTAPVHSSHNTDTLALLFISIYLILLVWQWDLRALEPEELGSPLLKMQVMQQYALHHLLTPILLHDCKHTFILSSSLPQSGKQALLNHTLSMCTQAQQLASAIEGSWASVPIPNTVFRYERPWELCSAVLGCTNWDLSSHLIYITASLWHTQTKTRVRFILSSCPRAGSQVATKGTSSDVGSTLPWRQTCHLSAQDNCYWPFSKCASLIYVTVSVDQAF